MLQTLQVHNLALIQSLEIQFESGLTALTGETGSGKSILIEALSLVMGERATSALLQKSGEPIEISASFDLTTVPLAIDWLTQQALFEEEACILRRVINQDGRSRAFINGKLVTLSQLRDFTQLLVAIHSQHQHHALLQPDYQRQLLDAFGNHSTLLAATEQAYKHWSILQETHQRLVNAELNSAQQQWLQFQLNEFTELNLQPNEFEKIEQEFKQLSQTDTLLTTSQHAIDILQNQDNNVLQQITSIEKQLQPFSEWVPEFKNALDLLQQANIQLDETSNELNNFNSTIQLQTEKQQQIEARLQSIHALARKYKLNPEDIPSQVQQIQRQLDEITNKQSSIEQLEQQMQEAKQAYRKIAQQLSQQRTASAILLSKAVAKHLRELNLPKMKFEIEVSTKDEEAQPTPHGLDQISYIISTNPGLPAKPLKQVASGGELSRISLAIQVITAAKMTKPILIFDEVDVGISGKTAQMVGNLLRSLGKHCQVFCVTHLPQVAALAHHHIKVAKHQSKAKTTTKAIQLKNEAEKIDELASMLGGIEITPQAIANAQALRKLTDCVD